LNELHPTPSRYAQAFSLLAALAPGQQPHAWQVDLAMPQACDNRLVRVPTGLGKTFGVLGAWWWNRIAQRREGWPRRLVWCLPMRVLVEQVVAEAEAALARVGSQAVPIPVRALMGGAEAGDWHLSPGREAVLVGTQDMLLSRALNRGYAAPRARWPMDFGLLNQDCLWVMDEVQLMDAGLATSAQLQAFREEEQGRGASLRPCKTWWMSATLQPAWVNGGPDTREPLRDLAQIRIPPAQRSGPLWDAQAVRKPLQVRQVQPAGKPPAHASLLAALVAEAHAAGGRGARGPTLVVVNRVERAVEIYKALAAAAKGPSSGTDLRLVHSRFRPADRAHWRESFLNRAACAPGVDRIIVATQVVEAGVDISAGVLVTELAPWPSLVQRFGRCARYGGEADVIVFDALAADRASAAPYAAEELEAARSALALVDDVAPRSLEAFEEAHPERAASLYPYRPAHLLLRHELDELFDTSADLSGADVDVSRFIRSGDERDLSVFWSEVPKGETPGADRRADRDALCAVPFLAARDWLCGKETGSSKAPRLARGRRAWVWEYLSGRWRTAERRDLYPGQTVLVAADTGGYDSRFGWSPASSAAVPALDAPQPSAEDRADASEDDESLSAVQAWQTIATHGAQVGREAAALAAGLGKRYERLFDLAGRWHDAGKALAPFQNSIVGDDRPARLDLAKAPPNRWLPGRRLYPDPPHPRRAGLRHELASTLALFDVLARHRPEHAAMVGPWRELLASAGRQVPAPAGSGIEPNALEQEILELDADDFDLLAYLVCAHHGKVRMAWHASPADQEAGDTVLRLRGVREGEELPALTLTARDGTPCRLPPSRLRLDAAAVGLNPVTGRGWTERTLGLLARQGPFALAYLEALLRAADQRASRAPVGDPLLEPDNTHHGLEASHRELAPAEPAGAPSSALAAHSTQRGAEHGVRGRAGEPGSAGSGTRPPPHATRHVETAQGVLTYAELAPLLGERVAAIERAIESGEFDDQALDDALIRELHARLCGDLVPTFAGWRRKDVVIGSHEPMPHFKVPMGMREYALDLAARLGHLDAQPDLLPEFLAFAEGRLLSIHPFADFNGRATRLFLRLVLRRLELPAVDLVPSAEATADYLQALAAGDRAHWAPLAAIWRERLAQEGGA